MNWKSTLQRSVTCDTSLLVLRKGCSRGPRQRNSCLRSSEFSM